MKINRLATIVGLTAMLATSAAMAQPAKDMKSAEVGKAAPAFSLSDTDGKTHELADFKGKIVVLQWINPDCPVCRGITSDGKVTAMVEELKDIDENVVFLPINSTYYMEAEQSAEYLTSHKIKEKALIDKDGKVGRSYGAKTTPHIFVIDTEGVLRFNGAFDDDPRGSKGDDATNYAVKTVAAIAAGETVSPTTSRPYGCSVKYAGGGRRGKGRRGGG